jgi:D-sedoheptulose 7-phosphate isomerase
MKFEEPIKNYLNELQNTISSLNSAEIDNFLDVLMNAYNNGSTIFIFGNGGSAATASHFATDLNKGISYGLEKRFRVMALTDNFSTVSAYSNDTSYDDVFVEQMKNFIKPGDLVIGISGSGNSKNVIKAIEYANSHGNPTVGITGYDGGKLRQIANHSVNANIKDMQISEDIHMILGHLTMKVLNGIIRNEQNPSACK